MSGDRDLASAIDSWRWLQWQEEQATVVNLQLIPTDITTYLATIFCDVLFLHVRKLCMLTVRVPRQSGALSHPSIHTLGVP